ADAHGHARLVLGRLEVVHRSRGGLDRDRAARAVALLEPADRHPDEVVLPLAEDAALALGDARDRERPAVDEDLLADGLHLTEEGVQQIGPDDHEGPGALHVVGAELARAYPPPD